MAKLRLLPFNVLDFDTTVLLVTGSGDSGYPESRLYDRSIDFYWKYTNTGNVTFHIEQGGGLTWPVVNTLIIERHNFTGRAMTWEYSDNGGSWSPMIAGWTQDDNLQIVKISTETSAHRWYRIVVTGAVNPKCSEIYMSGYYEFPVRFDEPPQQKDVDNVIWTSTLGGIERSNKLGDVRRGRIYSLFLFPEALISYREAIEYLDEFSKPFYIRDHENDYWFARFRELPGGTFITEQQQEKEVELLEIL